MGASGEHQLSHLDEKGSARMVDVTAKDDTNRTAKAEALVHMLPATMDLIRSDQVPKGDVYAVARIAGIMAAKRTSELIPMCHPLAITSIAVNVAPLNETTMRIEATVRTSGKTGVEMEALTAASVAALTVYDMCKAVDRGMRVTNVRLLEKAGGKSGHWVADGQRGS
ncbi:MAG TPA: cyclic pyranopterin monophosphate synthase MoaC [Dehalococcoidia bacterium]|nr:cyclic pyranopterin monophosphate synthase MoaC [Dehalococcoidia bacterium]